MQPDLARSEQVIDAFKRRKLAASVYMQIRRIIRGFEEDAKMDRQIAEAGIVILLIVTGLAAYLMRIF